MDEAEFVRHGLYDPEAPNAADQLALLRFNVEHGITIEKTVEAERAGRLAYVVADPIMRGEGLRLGVDEAGERSGLSGEQVVRMWRAAGFAEPAPDDRPFSESDLEVLPVLAMAETVFGMEVALQLVRVIGSAMARIAEAEIMAFGRQVSGKTATEGWSEFDVAKLHVEVLARLLSQTGKAFDMLHRRHLEAVSRRLAPHPFGSAVDRKAPGGGFADLCGCRALSDAMTLPGSRRRGGRIRGLNRGSRQCRGRAAGEADR